MTVLVTGATGFLGGHCVRGLATTTPVIATGRSQQALDMLAMLPNVSTVAADLTDPAMIERLAALQPTAIVHSAARSSLWGNLEDFYAANVIATRHVLDIAERCGAELVHISTPTLYMDGTNRLNLDESSPRADQGVNTYAETKRLAEIEVRSRRIPTVILRPQGIVGAGDTAVAPRFLRAMRRGFFPLMNGGRARSELTHVANVVQAIDLALRADKNPAEPREFNITNGEPMTTRELLDLFLAVRQDCAATGQDSAATGQGDTTLRTVRYLPVPERLLELMAVGLERASLLTGGWEPTVTGYSVQVLSRDRTFDISAARSELGYDPTGHTIRQAFVDFFAAAS